MAFASCAAAQARAQLNGVAAKQDPTGQVARQAAAAAEEADATAAAAQDAKAINSAIAQDVASLATQATAAGSF